MLENKPVVSPSFIFVVPGDPVPWARPKPSNRGMYDGQKHLKLVTISHINKQLPQDFTFYEGALALTITFYFKRPITRHGSMYDDESPHFFKPDLSNLIKHVEDCCTGTLYKDDSRISVIHAFKKYGNPRTEFFLEEL